MTTRVTAAQVRLDLLARREIALIDLREEDPFARAHPLFAACLPLSRLELEIFDRIPRRATPVVLYDDGEGLVEPAVGRLAVLGYTDVRVLQGGLGGWRDAGYELFQDVNSYSKAFGELVETRRHTPSFAAEELDALIKAKADLVVLDARRWDEYQTMSIPTGVSVPGAELVLRARDLAPDPATTIVVNCAGRTRTIIGAQSLINAGLPNRVAALRNGAIGWTLAGQSLEHGQDRRFADAPPGHVDEAREKARAVAYRAGVRRITPEQLAELERDEPAPSTASTCARRKSMRAAISEGFRSAPGGQLVQETDMFAPVRGGRIVLADDLGPRADMTASWLAQMGWEALVLDGGFDRPLETGAWRPHRPPAPDVDHQRRRSGRGVGGDASPSSTLGRAPAPPQGAYPRRLVRHPRAAGVRWRGSPKDRPIVLTSADGVLARSPLGTSPRGSADAGAGRRRGGLARRGPADGDWHCPRRGHDVEDVYRRPYEGADHAAAPSRPTSTGSSAWSTNWPVTARMASLSSETKGVR